MMLISKDVFSIYYNLLYAFTFFIALLGSLQIDVKNNQVIINNFFKKIAIIILLSYIILVGLRAYNVGTDTWNYYLFNWQIGFEPKPLEMLFTWIIRFIKFIGGSFTWFLLIMSFVFFATLYKAYFNISKKFKTQSFYIFFCFISFFFAKNISTNVIRQGVSLAILVYAYSVWINTNNTKKIIPLLILSLVTHSTAIIPLVFFLIINIWLKNINLKYFLILYFIGIVLAAINIGILNVAPIFKDILADNPKAGYLTGESEVYVVGFKPQFVAFNTVFTIIFYFISKKIDNTSIKYMYDILFKYFLLTSFLFFMVFQIPYSDRWGLFGWMSLPILASPFFSLINYTQTYRTIWVLFFGFIYLFFAFYG